MLTISGTGKMADWGSTSQPWYNYRNTITSVTILSGVTSIGEAAFQSCTSLKSVTIPTSVTSIGENAFSYCESLSSVIIPASVTSIGEDAFLDCTSLKSMTIPSSVTSIGDGVFVYCTSLTAINVAGGNKNYCSEGGVLFNKAKTELIQYPGGKSGAYSIPSGVTGIRDFAFEGCASLTSVTIPASVTSIGLAVFRDCPSLTSITVDGGNKNYCSEGGVLFNKAKTELIQCPGGKSGAYSIPSGVTSIGRNAVAYCGSLTSVTIPAGVTSIGVDAFQLCDSLTSVTIPGSVTSIGRNAVAYCGSLTSVTILSGVTSIGDYVFQSCTSLTSVTIPASVTSIGNNAFANCSADLVIYGKKGSYAESYAKENGIKFSAETAPKYSLPAPKLSKVENVNGGVKVTWGKVTGAEKYRVFYKPSGGSWAKAGDTTSTSYTWKGAKSGTTYQFRVWCVSADGKKATSTYDAIKTITYIAAPQNVAVSSVSNGVKVTWTKSAGAAKYRLFYKPSGGSWAKAGDTTSTSYTWTGAKSGTTYQFRVWCISADGKAQTSTYDAIKTITYIAAPSYTLSTPSTGGIKLSWTKVTGASKYKIYYKTTGDWKTLTTTTATSYTVKSPKAGTKYTFRVRCVDSAGAVISGYITDKTLTYMK